MKIYWNCIKIGKLAWTRYVHELDKTNIRTIRGTSKERDCMETSSISPNYPKMAKIAVFLWDIWEIFI